MPVDMEQYLRVVQEHLRTAHKVLFCAGGFVAGAIFMRLVGC